MMSDVPVRMIPKAEKALGQTWNILMRAVSDTHRMREGLGHSKALARQSLTQISSSWELMRRVSGDMAGIEPSPPAQ